MKGFLYKEFALSRSTLIILLIAVMLIFGGSVFITTLDDGNNLLHMAQMCFFLAYFTVSSITGENFSRDERAVWCAFAASSPSGVKGYMAAKYIYYIILNLAVMFLGNAAGAVMTVMHNDTAYTMTDINTVLFCAQLLMTAVEMPFIVRFGSDKGLNLKMCIGAAIVTAVLIYALYGDITPFLNNNFTEALRILFTQEALIWGVTALIWLSPVLYYLSYRLSVKLYTKGIGNYEQ